jgi:hypothetical protein
MKRIWLVPLSGALVMASMAFTIDDASAYRAGVRGVGVNRVGVNRVGINRVGVNRVGYRGGIYRGGAYGTRYGYGAYRPGLRVAAAGLAVGAAAASTGAYYGDGAYYNRRAYYNTTDGMYDGGAFAGGVYRPAGAIGYDGTAAGRAYANAGNYPTREIVKRSYVPMYSYYGPLCHPRIDGGCQ